MYSMLTSILLDICFQFFVVYTTIGKKKMNNKTDMTL